MRVIFMGTPDFSVGTLEALIRAGHDVCLAVTQPDKPKGRGKEMQFPPVKETALKHGIPVYQPRRIREPECVEELRKYNADIMVVIAFGQILPKEILEMTPYGCINVHASLLPKYRGAAPIQWSIINGESVTGVTTMQMDEGLDTGDMILKKEVPIAEDETGESLHDKLAQAGAELCVETLKALEDHTAVFEKQGESPTAYAKMLTKEMGIWKAKAEEARQDASVQPGTVTEVAKDHFTVSTGDGVLRVYEVQIPGKKRMETGAFLRGYAMEPGTVLG